MPSASPAAGSGRRKATPRLRSRSWMLVVAGVTVFGLSAVSGYALDKLASADVGLVGPTPQASAPPSPPSSPSPTSRPRSPSPTPSPIGLLSSPGSFPSEGSGSFRYRSGEGPLLGDSGKLLRFRVAVEDDIDEDLDEFAEFVETTLGDEQGWTAGGDVRFQRVPEGSSSDFTIYLATSGTTEQLCARGGLAVVTPSLPDGGVSCRVGGQVVLNLHRWRLSVAHYVEQEVPLTVYRQMVLNHEVGHELGYGHHGCPEPGGPAPVMQQQTLFLDGCSANPWPYVDDVRHTGPPVS